MSTDAAPTGSPDTSVCSSQQLLASHVVPTLAAGAKPTIPRICFPTFQCEFQLQNPRPGGWWGKGAGSLHTQELPGKVTSW